MPLIFTLPYPVKKQLFCTLVTMTFLQSRHSKPLDELRLSAHCGRPDLIFKGQRTAMNGCPVPLDFRKRVVYSPYSFDEDQYRDLLIP